MRVSYLISGFPGGFTDEFIDSVNTYYSESGNFVFIASDFERHDLTDEYSAMFIDMFYRKGIQFESTSVIDNRVTVEEAHKMINDAAIVWLTGGDTLKQIGHLNDYGLKESLLRRQGITIGISAGAINMAEHVLLARDLNDDIPALSIYEGMGLVDINIEPHINEMTEEHMKDIEEATLEGTIIGIPDKSFIVVTEEKTEYIGDYEVYEKR